MVLDDEKGGAKWRSAEQYGLLRICMGWCEVQACLKVLGDVCGARSGAWERRGKGIEEKEEVWQLTGKEKLENSEGLGGEGR